jgi:hypothetical protein
MSQNNLILSAVAAAAIFHSVPSFGQKPQSFTSPDQVPKGLAKSDWASIRHAFHPVDDDWQALNPGHNAYYTVNKIPHS